MSTKTMFGRFAAAVAACAVVEEDEDEVARFVVPLVPLWPADASASTPTISVSN
ncbi:hypothetical protein ACIRU3_34765 [Streptomyces sp. NPDC101151]|uniref:hypothetical protein n=1 Tax=Streptomyces sp. NPDC101151 TaxID=3366115 RepID=UPI003819EAC3